MPGWGELGEVVERFGLVSIRYFVRVLSQVTNIDITMLFHCLTHNTSYTSYGCVVCVFFISPCFESHHAAKASTDLQSFHTSLQGLGLQACVSMPCDDGFSVVCFESIHNWEVAEKENTSSH